MFEHSLMQQGVDLMFFGMGTVFVFLTLLVLSTYLMSTFINKFFPEKIKLGQAKVAQINNASFDDTLEKDEMLAIEKAIAEHRARRK